MLEGAGGPPLEELGRLQTHADLDMSERQTGRGLIRKALCAVTGQDVGHGQSGRELPSPVTRDRERETKAKRRRKRQEKRGRSGRE